MKHHIAIAGNIGAGKTNLAKKLAEHFDWELFQEPFQENPYLENYYQDMGKWAFHCEMFFLSRRLKDQLAIIKSDKSILQDRCLYEGAEVFVKNLFLNNSSFAVPYLNSFFFRDDNIKYQVLHSQTFYSLF